MQNMTYNVNIFVDRSERCSGMHVYKAKNKQSVLYRARMPVHSATPQTRKFATTVKTLS